MHFATFLNNAVEIIKLSVLKVFDFQGCFAAYRDGLRFGERKDFSMSRIALGASPQALQYWVQCMIQNGELVFII